MASGKETSGSVDTSGFSQRSTDGAGKTIQVHDRKCGEKPKPNRLKRANRSNRSDLQNECEVIGPDDQKGADTLGSPDVLHTAGTTERHNRVGTKSSTWCHRPQQQSSVRAVESGREGHEETSAMTSVCHNLRVNTWPPIRPAVMSSQTASGPPSSSRCVGDAHSRGEILQQVQTRNPQFPVPRVIQTLLKRLGESKSALVVPVTGKRKQEVEADSTGGCFPKRRRACQAGSETLKASKGQTSSGHGKICRNRLRRNPAPVRDAAVGDARPDQGRAGRDDDGGHAGDVPLTETFRPRSCHEVVGNTAAVGKLYSWLKKWRMRADVEERRRRREERQRKEESDGSWDFGDFEGDPLTEECERPLCNTLLIHGPTGAGKTAAVFACAEQLGFKVLEVNSSSLRTGRLVLSQLSESTQSHRVGAPHPSVAHTHTAASGGGPAGFSPKTGKLASEHSGISSDTKAAVEATPDERENSESAAVSLVLFEEVDIVFEEDVGFLAAVKSLMSTSKRPIVLTANDPLFGESFGGRFQMIRFKNPATESVVSFLQCVCVVQGVKPDQEHIRFLLQENNGDVRQSVLQLELWARSGAGNTLHHLHNRALSCSSYAELESSGCVGVLVDCWRKGRSLLYSFLDRLAPPMDKKAAERNSDKNAVRNRNHLKSTPPLRPAVPLEQMNQSAAEAGDLPPLESLVHFFDAVSFADSHLSRRTGGNPGRLRAKVRDGLLDEPGDEDEDAMKTRGLERCCEIQAAVEGLGFHRCRMKAYPIKRDATGEARARRVSAVIRRLIHTEAFRHHGGRSAVLIDYLPCLRFICRLQQPRLGYSHYLREIGLRLPKSLLDLLASPFP